MNTELLRIDVTIIEHNITDLCKISCNIESLKNEVIPLTRRGGL
jgi:hypothetical protein